MADLRSKYEKCLVLLNQIAGYSYKLESENTKLKNELEPLKEDVNLFYPKFPEYKNYGELRKKLYFTSLDETNTFFQLKYLLNKDTSQEAGLIHDLERLKANVRSMMEVDFENKQLHLKHDLIQNVMEKDKNLNKNIANQLQTIQQVNHNLIKKLTDERVMV